MLQFLLLYGHIIFHLFSAWVEIWQLLFVFFFFFVCLHVCVWDYFYLSSRPIDKYRNIYFPIFVTIFVLKITNHSINKIVWNIDLCCVDHDKNVWCRHVDILICLLKMKHSNNTSRFSSQPNRSRNIKGILHCIRQFLFPFFFFFCSSTGPYSFASCAELMDEFFFPPISKIPFFFLLEQIFFASRLFISWILGEKNLIFNNQHVENRIVLITPKLLA